jgi:hypothetical protein
VNKTVKLYIGIFVLAVIAMLYYEQTKAKPINWYPSFIKKHKIPYGTYVLYNELSELFPKSKVENIAIPPYVYLKNNDKEGTYLFIDNEISFGEDEFNQLIQFVDKGNDVFISTNGCNIDTLGLKTQILYNNSSDDTAFFKLYNTAFKNKEYSFNRSFSNIVFSEIDTTKVIILGQSGFVNKDGERTDSGVNFIKYPYGSGNFYFHTFPKAFTNYQILNSPNQAYTSGLLSFLDNPETILWDGYYKTGKSQISSPMHYILKSESLKWSYFFTLIGVLFFIIFEGKRKQRSIPIIKPLKNQTLAFTRTIANMYYEKAEHKNIAEHKIQYLLEYIRTKLRIPTIEINTQFYKTLAARSGKSEESIQKLFNFIEFIHQKNQITQSSLEDLNKMIENFKSES